MAIAFFPIWKSKQRCYLLNFLPGLEIAFGLCADGIYSKEKKLDGRSQPSADLEFYDFFSPKIRRF